MEENRHYRAVNMLITTFGTFACIGSGFFPAKEGMLGDESLSIMQDMSPHEVMIWLAVPAVLSVMTLILVAGARFRALMLLTSLAAGAMYLYTDAGYVMVGQNFPGILLNATGVVLLLTGAALQVFATPAKAGIAAVNTKNCKYKDMIEDAQTGEMMTAFYGSAADPEAAAEGAEAGSAESSAAPDTKETAEPQEAEKNAEPQEAEKNTETPEPEKSEEPADAEKEAEKPDTTESAEPQEAEKKTETVDISEKLAEADEAILKAEEAAAEGAEKTDGKASPEKSWDTEEELISLLSELIDEEKKDTEKKDLPEISAELKGELAEIFAEINKGDN